MKTAHDLVTEARTRTQEITIEQAAEAIREADVLIDVREADEFAGGHIAGALNIPRGVLEFKIGGMPSLESRDLHIVVYCKTSGRAALAANALQEMGYLHVQSIAGGFDAWTAAGLPTEKPHQPRFD